MYGNLQMDSGWFWQFISSKLLAPGMPRLHDTALSLSLILPLAFHSKPRWHSVCQCFNKGQVWERHSSSITFNQLSLLTILLRKTTMCGLGSKGTSSEKNCGVAAAGCQARRSKQNGVHVYMVSNKRTSSFQDIWYWYPRYSVSRYFKCPHFTDSNWHCSSFLAFHPQRRRCGQTGHRFARKNPKLQHQQRININLAPYSVSDLAGPPHWPQNKGLPPNTDQ